MDCRYQCGNLPINITPMNNNVRKSISKKIRFEVLKRDNFTCQYCSVKAPNAVLEIDHIIPVCKGGKNDLNNLNTACYACNRGKSGNELINIDIKINYKTIFFKYGFKYKSVRYVWKDKKLFRLPYIKNNRSYGFKKIPFYCFKSTIVYNIQRTKLTINRLKELTEKIKWTHNFIIDDDCPF